MITPASPVRVRLGLCLGSCLLFVITADAETALPPPEFTEVWSPQPPAVDTTRAVPSDAIVLFDGSSLDAWAGESGKSIGWKIASDGALTITPGSGGIETKTAFGSVQLHLEFRSPADVEGEGQKRGNSGVFFMGRYELQILDSYQNETYANGGLGSVYKQAIPLANPARPPGQWQTVDALFTAPRFSGAGELESPARLTVLINGVVVQHDFVLIGPTEFRGTPVYAAHAAELPILLQEHRDFVSFRNIWARRLP